MATTQNIKKTNKNFQKKNIRAYSMLLNKIDNFSTVRQWSVSEQVDMQPKLVFEAVLA